MDDSVVHNSVEKKKTFFFVSFRLTPQRNMKEEQINEHMRETECEHQVSEA